jgi:hypothetical protein
VVVRSDELITEIRMRGFFPDAHDDYTDARLLKEFNACLPTLFSQMVVDSRAGYYLDDVIGTTTAGLRQYRIPGRAIMGGLEKVEIANNAGEFRPLTEITPYDAGQLEGPYTAPTRGFPSRYLMVGDQVQFFPCPDAAYNYRFRYYRRPSRLVTQQSSTLSSGTIRGQVTAVNTTARTVTVNVVPYDMEAVSGGAITPAAITSGSCRIDIIHGDGWHELALTNAVQTLSSTTFTIAGSASMERIEVGDWVRAAEQSDWPQLPDDFHATLVDATSVLVLTSMGLADKASSIAQKMQGDIQRFRALLAPRVKDAARIIKPSFSRLHGRTTQWRIS